MFKNYFLVAVRNLYRNKYYALINILGLGTAMALCVVGYLNHQFSLSFNAGQKNVDRIAAIASYTLQDGERQDVIQHPTPLAPAIAADLPGVKGFCRMAADAGDVRAGDRVFEEALWFVDSAFFDIFTFEREQGEVEAFYRNQAGVVITGDMARRFFGDSSATGERLSITMSNGKLYDFNVVAVVAEPPLNSSFYGGVYLPYNRQREIFGYDLDSWTDWTSASFLLLDEHVPIAQVSAALDRYLERTNAANPNSERNGFFLVPMRDIPALVQDIGGPMREGMHPAAILAPSVIALLILLLACFNFMNTSIAFAARRFREIGVRKVVGGMRSQLVWQFLGENLLLCLIALVFAAALAEIVVPAYGSLWPEIDLSFSYAESPALIAFLLGLLLFTAVAAGLYPALYISRFNATAIFRGRQKLGGTNALIRVLLTAQLALSMTCIVGAAILTRNAAFLRDFDYGYDEKNTLVVPIESPAQYQGIRNAMAGRADVLGIAATEHIMNRYWATFNVTVDGNQMLVNSYRVGDNFLESLRFNLLTGRMFDTSLVTDRDRGVLVNQTLVQQAGWGDAVGRTVTLTIDNAPRDYHVIGVIADFYPNVINSVVRPAIIRQTPPERYRYAILRVGEDDHEAVFAGMEQFWKDNYPNLAFEGFWQDRRMQNERDTNDNIRIIFFCVAVIAMLISVMGLLALVSLNIARRTREIGIRKALGASMAHVCALITREFVVIVLIGSGLAVGIGYYLTDILLSSIWDYYCDFGVAPFIVSVVMIFAVAGLSVGYRVWAAARSNPVDALRYE